MEPIGKTVRGVSFAGVGMAVLALALVCCTGRGAARDGLESASPQGMVEVPAGAFFRGCSPVEAAECEGPEMPGRQIELDGFWIDRLEVTVADYTACVRAGVCDESGLAVPQFRGEAQPEWAWACNWDKPGREDHPINCLSWDQARDYCRWANKRLPTEAEWEKAARGTDGRKYAWGNEEYAELARQGRIVANVADESERRRDPRWHVAEGYDDGHTGTAPVGHYPEGASPYGALDMTGNVLEWVADFHSDDYYAKSEEHNPLGPSHGHERMARGGAWYGEPETTRVSLRWPAPARRLVAVGVRCAASYGLNGAEAAGLRPGPDRRR